MCGKPAEAFDDESKTCLMASEPEDSCRKRRAIRRFCYMVSSPS
jgi:hypothetical protein